MPNVISTYWGGFFPIIINQRHSNTSHLTVSSNWESPKPWVFQDQTWSKVVHAGTSLFTNPYLGSRLIVSCNPHLGSRLQPGNLNQKYYEPPRDVLSCSIFSCPQGWERRNDEVSAIRNSDLVSGTSTVGGQFMHWMWILSMAMFEQRLSMPQKSSAQGLNPTNSSTLKTSFRTELHRYISGSSERFKP